RRAFTLLGQVTFGLMIVAGCGYLAMMFLGRDPSPATPEASAETPPLAAAPAQIATGQSFAAASSTAAAQARAPSRLDDDAINTSAVNAASTARMIRGVSDTEIRLGMVGPFSGPAKEMGHQLKLGVETAFAEANDGGRIGGRQVKL